MICPACKSDMIVVEYNDVELDWCTSCQGVWFDATELELLLKSMGIDSQNLLLNDIFNSPEARLLDKRRKCPRCERKMKEANIGGHPEILVDVCPQGHGLWFDGGEVGQLLKQLAGKQPVEQDSRPKVISFLGEVFKARD